MNTTGFAADVEITVIGTDFVELAAAVAVIVMAPVAPDGEKRPEAETEPPVDDQLIAFVK
jgi:hypothetical protein